MKLKVTGCSASCFLSIVLVFHLLIFDYLSYWYSSQHNGQYSHAKKCSQSNVLAPGAFVGPRLFSIPKRLDIKGEALQSFSSIKAPESTNHNLISAAHKRILITGSTGLLGVQLLEDAVQRKLSITSSKTQFFQNKNLSVSNIIPKQYFEYSLEIYATARNPRKLQEQLRMYPKWKDHVTFYDAFNILNKQNCLDIIRQSEPHVIINCVSSKMEHASDYAISDPTYLSSIGIGGIDQKTDSMCDDFEVCWKGMANLIEACKQQYRNFRPLLILVSAIGAAESRGWIPAVSFDTLRVWLASKSIAEKITKQSKFPYTIVRPCPLTEESDDVSAILSKGPNVFGAVRRKHLANCIMNCLFSEKAINQTLSAVGASSVLHANPFVRPYEFYEPLLFEEFIL